mmetsp:Transcript_149405/g.260533  ORF Transcript_149405/g.260533 Transcript_149405/m.260533 type:complete len:252 (+) Transcript_149405:77-832(+)
MRSCRVSLRIASAELQKRAWAAGASASMSAGWRWKMGLPGRSERCIAILRRAIFVGRGTSGGSDACGIGMYTAAQVVRHLSHSTGIGTGALPGVAVPTSPGVLGFRTHCLTTRRRKMHHLHHGHLLLTGCLLVAVSWPQLPRATLLCRLHQQRRRSHRLKMLLTQSSKSPPRRAISSRRHPEHVYGSATPSQRPTEFGSGTRAPKRCFLLMRQTLVGWHCQGQAMMQAVSSGSMQPLAMHSLRTRRHSVCT